jgi:hypothetical protein
LQSAAPTVTPANIHMNGLLGAIAERDDDFPVSVKADICKSIRRASTLKPVAGVRR